MTGGLIQLNGVATPAPDAGMRLLDWLRDHVDERGPKEGCGAGQCGSCLVLVDGQPVPSCCLLVQGAVGRQVWTSSGLVRTPTGRLLQGKFAEHGAVQCGFCAPGMLVAAVAWLDRRPAGEPGRDDIARALAGNVCRCGGYLQIVDALVAAARADEGAP